MKPSTGTKPHEVIVITGGHVTMCHVTGGHVCFVVTFQCCVVQFDMLI